MFAELFQSSVDATWRPRVIAQAASRSSAILKRKARP